MRTPLRGWSRGDDPELLLRREWLVTNGRGGYATGTLAGATTRRYHGLLVAALPPPLGRYVMLNHLEERLEYREWTRQLSGDEPATGAPRLPDLDFLREFRLERGLPLWEFDDSVVRLRKRVVMPHLENTTWIEYALDSSSPAVRLVLTPGVHFRPHEGEVSTPLSRLYATQTDERGITLRERDDLPPLTLCADGGIVSFEPEPRIIPERLFRTEKSRGYAHAGELWSPGSITIELQPGETASLRCSVEREPIRSFLEIAEGESRRRDRLLADAGVVEDEQPLLGDLVFAADQFIIVPSSRNTDASSDARTVIAGYHWFTDWGRDTMISLEGLTLATGRWEEAASILRTFARYVRHGLIPNMFPEGEHEGLYHTADATLWFFHAVDRYVAHTNDRELLAELLPTLDDIIEHHLRGTDFNIGVDPADGLLRQGAAGYQLTWMDAKVDDWVVTPRRGKAVELNALFFNAVSLLIEWREAEGDQSRAVELRRVADRTRIAFNERFWDEQRGHLLDVVDGDDPASDVALRPNQIFSVSLPHPVLAPERWERVVTTVEDELLTPFGLRSLARAHPDYKRSYDGDLRSRDAAYHQGTVWSWLIGPFFDAYLRVHPNDHVGARRLLDGLARHLRDAGVGSVSEVFDAEAPYEPRGCIAQAWGVAELLRCLRRLQ